VSNAQIGLKSPTDSPEEPKFVAEVKSIFAQIKRNPSAGKPDEEGCRRLRVAGFSFSVVFREEPTEVVVYVIRPDQRQPGYWHGRAR
jgi:hypothetical protein